MRALLVRLTLALLVLVASGPASAAASLAPSHEGPARAGVVRAGDAASVAPFEQPPASAPSAAPRVVAVPLPTPIAAPIARTLARSEAAAALGARRLRTLPQRRIRRHATRGAPDDF